ncbi:TIGR02453 family protein [Parasedimentitalea maritima]|uniref:TIGR02453 family protein n=1 Tax=Parasedimentitalea maritima TaxID=2578117 RepID=A0A6A4RC71_9RHOB|nr:TIGR02453 family protein [Zongyanglinia marina]KAE9627588.1 TIGR02453 family protein [Zongyanglinia marina]
MTDPFALLIPEAKTFLTELAANNTRDWFTAHKPQYEAQLKNPALLLQEQLLADLAKTTDVSVTSKLFRPHRDVRFSKDKTPYHTHLHMFWMLDGPVKTAFFLGISPSYCRIGGGVMGFEKDQLTHWRAAVDGKAGGTISALMDKLSQDKFNAEDPELKRVPAPFAKDHPQASLLRRKSLSVWRDLPQTEWSQPLAALNTGFSKVSPLCKALSQMLT